MYYSEYFSSPISESQVKRFFGISPADQPALAIQIGIYPLTQAPSGFTAERFVKVGNTYVAVAREVSDREYSDVERVRALAGNLTNIVNNTVAAWNSTTTYSVGDIVLHNEQVWKALTANPNVEPSIDTITDWDSFA